MVSWPARGRGPVRLRACGLRPRMYYRMDSAPPAESASYRWPADVLNALRIGIHEIGVVAWTRMEVGSTSRDVFLPVSIGDPVSDRSYDLLVLPGDEFSEIFVSLTAVSQEGQPERVIWKARPLRYGYYPAGRPVPIRINRPAAHGVYRVELAGLLRAGGSTTQEMWFLN